MNARRLEDPGSLAGVTRSARRTRDICLALFLVFT